MMYTLTGKKKKNITAVIIYGQESLGGGLDMVINQIEKCCVSANDTSVIATLVLHECIWLRKGRRRIHIMSTVETSHSGAGQKGKRACITLSFILLVYAVLILFKVQYLKSQSQNKFKHSKRVGKSMSVIGYVESSVCKDVFSLDVPTTFKGGMVWSQMQD